MGSSAYPNFCAFGKFIDNTLEELGGERLIKLTCGDEMCAQEQCFRKWAPEVFKVACDSFCLEPDVSVMEMKSESLNINTVRFLPLKNSEPLEKLLAKYHNRKVFKFHAKHTPKSLTNLGENIKATICLEISSPGVKYEPGDHVGIFPANHWKLVDGIISRLTGCDFPEDIVQLQILKEKQSLEGEFFMF